MKHHHFKSMAALVLAAALAWSALTGCGAQRTAGTTAVTTAADSTAATTASAPATTAAATTAATTGPAEDSSETTLFTDSCGREVEIPKKLSRVAPSGGVAQMVLVVVRIATDPYDRADALREIVT